MRKLWAEFKKFISRGSVIDLAVGMVIGSAFTKIVTSLVNDILMPLIALAVGKTHLAELVWVLKKTPVLGEDGAQVVVDGVAQFNTITLNYGTFIQVIIDFLLIALSLFLLLKLFNAVKDHAKNSKERIKELTDKMEHNQELSKKESKWFRKQTKKVAAEAAAETAPAPEPAPTPEPSSTDKLLMEIVDLLKQDKVREAQAKSESAE